MHGQEYEFKFCALVLLRALNKGYKFKLGSNVEGLGKFDDCELEYVDKNYGKTHIFVQLKSKENRLKGKENKLITVSQLTTKKDGDFYIRKYYDSYIKEE
jgi:hypothetical protein